MKENKIPFLGIIGFLGVFEKISLGVLDFNAIHIGFGEDNKFKDSFINMNSSVH